MEKCFIKIRRHRTIFEIGILSIFFGLPAIICGLILGMKYLNIKKLEIEKEIQNNKIKLLEEENKKYDNIVNRS
jgi:hypothetical protein